MICLLELRALKYHGIQFNDNNKLEFVSAGFNYRMTDFQAALLISQFERFDHTLERKSIIAQEYLARICNENIILPVVPKNKLHSWQTFHVLIAGGKSQKQIIEYMKNFGVGVNYGAQCMPAQKYFFEKYGHDSSLVFPNAMHAFQYGIAIPLYGKLSTEQIDFIIKVINRI